MKRTFTLILALCLLSTFSFAQVVQTKERKHEFLLVNYRPFSETHKYTTGLAYKYHGEKSTLRVSLTLVELQTLWYC